MKIGGKWVGVVGWEDRYLISDDGHVWSIGKQKLLKTWSHEGGYPMVTLKRDGHKCNRPVHVLVLEAFVGPRPDGLVCCHNDGDPTNNNVENLRWDSHSANNHDLVRHGTHHQATKTHCSNGHEYTPENTRIYTRRGWNERLCRICQREHITALKRRMRAAS